MRLSCRAYALTKSLIAKKGFNLIERKITLSSIVAAPLRSPLGNSFFNNPFLLILPNLISSITPLPFL